MAAVAAARLKKLVHGIAETTDLIAPKFGRFMRPTKDQVG